METPLLELRVWIERPAHADSQTLVGGVLRLTCDERRKNRLRVRLEDGREAGIILPRGTILRDGDYLSDGTTLVVVRAAPESLSVATTPDPHLPPECRPVERERPIRMITCSTIWPAV